MSTLLESCLWHHPSVYVTENELAYQLGGSADSRYARIRRAKEKGLIIHLKRGLYYLGERLTHVQPHPFEAAQWIYGPSYISSESALSYHGLIPEAVPNITCVTPKRSQHIQTPLGTFFYDKLPLDNFYIGTHRIKENSHTFFMASVWKAILDYVYCYKKLWQNLTPLYESLRIDLDELPKVHRTDLLQFQQFYQRKNVDKFIAHIPGEYIDEY